MVQAALIIIDMENGFINSESAQCIKMAKATVPACSRITAYAREKNIPVFFVNRIYRSNGSDVEHTRFKSWYEGGKAMSKGCRSELSYDNPVELSPQRGDYVIIKPRFSAFFMTELDLILRRIGIDTIILAGTTTPNCIRTTCYDGISLDYNVVVIEDCCSSQTMEIQKANMIDMKNIGADIITSDELLNRSSMDFGDSLNKCRALVRKGI